MITDTFYILRMETEHFQWLTVGETKEECIKLLHKRWRAHMKNCNMPQSIRIDKTPIEEYYGTWTQKVKIGGAYIDDEGEE